MPVYTYRCENCGHEFDRQQRFDEKPLKACPNCRKRTLHKVYRPTGVVFKGSGFYVTDKKSASSTKNGKSRKPKESGSSEPKTETTGEKKTETKNEKRKPSSKED